MHLKDYIDPLDAAQRETLASELQTSVAYLSQLASGFRQPSPKLARRIAEVTNGQVRKEDLRPDLWPPVAA